MEYWNNPIIKLKMTDIHNDIFAQNLSKDQHIYYEPKLPLTQLEHPHSVDWLCEYANTAEFINDRYWMANLVKINIWTQSIRKDGILKPMLIVYNDEGKYIPETGSTRLICADLISELTHTEAFISCHSRNSSEFREKRTKRMFTVDRFAEYAGARADDFNVLSFKFTNNPDDFGLYWYEINLRDVGSATPSEEWCVQAYSKYIQENPDTTVTREWLSEQQFFYGPTSE
jgi:hypothetical protein